MICVEPQLPVRYVDKTKQFNHMAKQASRYGEQVRLLEDAGRMEERTLIRRAYLAFLRQANGFIDPHRIQEAYYEAYEQ